MTEAEQPAIRITTPNQRHCFFSVRRLAVSPPSPSKSTLHRYWWLDCSPNSTLMASGSLDTTTELWDTKKWQVQGNPIGCGARVRYVRYSPSGNILPSQQTVIFKYRIQTRGNVSKSSRVTLHSMEHGIFRSRCMPSISEDEMQKSVSSPQDTVAVELALKLYSSLDRL